MTAAAAQRWRQRLLGKRLEIARLVARQDQVNGQAERRINRQQLAIATEFESRQPGGFARAGTAMMTMSGGFMLGVMMMFADLSGLGGLHCGVQRADVDHQHGEQAKSDARCR